jgi:Circularly permutated YpsA SLOG family
MRGGWREKCNSATARHPQARSMPIKVISGGQTGVDRAALDAPLELAVPCGGWCPRGRKAEDGILAAHYPLAETATEAYSERTERNVLESDGTLALVRGRPSGGTGLTIDLARQHGKPCLVVDMARAISPRIIQDWINENQIQVLNVAGPRESQAPGIYDQARALIRRILELRAIE